MLYDRDLFVALADIVLAVKETIAHEHIVVAGSKVVADASANDYLVQVANEVVLPDLHFIPQCPVRRDRLVTEVHGPAANRPRLRVNVRGGDVYQCQK